LTARDAASELGEVGESELKERLAYMGLGAADLERLYRLRPLLEGCQDELEQELFGALVEVPQLADRLAGPGVREFIHGVFPEYLLSFSKRRFDEVDFISPRRELGARLECIGIEPQWVIRGYVVFFSLLASMLIRDFPEGDAEAGQAVATLARRVALDVELVLEGFMGQQRETFSSAADALTAQGERLRDDLSRRAEELRVAREQARLAGELASLGTLAAGLAHEIGTPMGVIQGHARLLQQDPNAVDAAWRLQTIQDQISRISRIIRTLLRIASPTRAEHAPVRLEPLIEESLEFLGDRLRGQSVVVKRVRDGGVRVVADAERLQQLFLNLFLNAADSMPDGGELSVEVERTGRDVVVRVSDSGSGIEEGHLERIFEPFFTTKEAGHGNGLGLMVCKRIVAEHAGTLAVESAPDEGTTFTIRMPAGGVAAIRS
jgi:signal transduction histidine kinase